MLNLLLTALLIAAENSALEPDTYKFSYSYPSQAAKITPLRNWLEARKSAERARTARDAMADRRAAAKEHRSFNPWDSQTEWKVVTETPRFLSLSANVYSFTGGAHGNGGSTALLWDKATRQRIAPGAVFVSAAALQAAVGQSYCALLRRERTKRVGAAANAPDSLFAKCPPLKDLTLLLGSSGGGRINRLGLIADPYVAGSYAEGAYEVTLPVTPAVLRAVKPAYRTAFALG